MMRMLTAVFAALALLAAGCAMAVGAQKGPAPSEEPPATGSPQTSSPQTSSPGSK